MHQGHNDLQSALYLGTIEPSKIKIFFENKQFKKW